MQSRLYTFFEPDRLEILESLFLTEDVAKERWINNYGSAHEVEFVADFHLNRQLVAPFLHLQNFLDNTNIILEGNLPIAYINNSIVNHYGLLSPEAQAILMQDFTIRFQNFKDFLNNF